MILVLTLAQRWDSMELMKLATDTCICMTTLVHTSERKQIQHHSMHNMCSCIIMLNILQLMSHTHTGAHTHRVVSTVVHEMHDQMHLPMFPFIISLQYPMVTHTHPLSQ